MLRLGQECAASCLSDGMDSNMSSEASSETPLSVSAPPSRAEYLCAPESFSTPLFLRLSTGVRSSIEKQLPSLSDHLASALYCCSEAADIIGTATGAISVF